ncbi:MULTISPECIES: efflux transporter outer membrane subunit [Bacteroides]|jgi:multidrug efflux system outer membrane protein|uniref:efflux transporter outer membrane subunit n=1 Tax=Bacteroides TaxID=816 RepID=UPI00051647E6|nr:MULTISPECIES: efflux transporter outer membrane subunit [Bacteroides]MCM0365035.1 efflux transporter outer membrane subunit [Bacteroides fragilis]MCY6291142.1 efflux transporter outer membrane subunit [Bacteroides fragilis]MCZ2618968.1 efflux transporter outer membrane subunit [Bacteroides fragilis]MDA1487493.1 efflux transporter outer membrane subunit [Bacteroides fragilis]MDY3140071.1 efflux transporter outer membrane subunit [Bacteroides sp.]
MKLRIGNIMFLLFLSSVAFPQATNRYLDKPLPQEWEEDAQIFQQVLPVDDQWWKAFQDPVLDSLISVAVKQNYSILTAIDRINMAKANLRMERGNFFPTIGLNAGWTRQQSSGNTSELPQSTQHYYDASLNMSWELDLFGSIRNRVKAQKENFAASKEEYTGTMVSLCAQVASAYINLRELQQELAVIQKNCASQEAVLKITEVRYNTGLVSKLDVAQAKSVFFSTKSSIPQIESGINQYITTLAILLGTYPQEIRPTLESPGILPDYMEPIGVGLPADLLLRRPDIRSAERSVNAQAALVGASKSDWLPQIFLKGSLGYAAKDLKDLTHHKSMTYEIAPALSWTLFKGTQLVNATKLAKAQLNEAINQFNQTVLTAVQETDNAMNAYRNSIKQIVALREVRNQGQETLTLSLELYKQGLTPFQNVLDAQRSLLSYENQLVQARGYSLLQLIAMYQALGGGWSGNLND